MSPGNLLISTFPDWDYKPDWDTKPGIFPWLWGWNLDAHALGSSHSTEWAISLGPFLMFTNHKLPWWECMHEDVKAHRVLGRYLLVTLTTHTPTGSQSSVHPRPKKVQFILSPSFISSFLTPYMLKQTPPQKGCFLWDSLSPIYSFHIIIPILCYMVLVCADRSCTRGHRETNISNNSLKSVLQL